VFAFDVITKNQTMGSVNNFFEKVFLLKNPSKNDENRVFRWGAITRRRISLRTMLGFLDR
jgi:hypothetical protein